MQSFCNPCETSDVYTSIDHAFGTHFCPMKHVSSYEFVIHVSSFAKLDMYNAISRLSDAYIRFRNTRLLIADHDQHEAYRCHCAKLVNISCTG
jgi:hypothetical protein